MNLKEKKKPLILFSIGILCLTAFLFWDEFRKNDPPDEQEPAWTAQETAAPTATDVTINEAKKQQAEEVNQETTFWMWSGKESGVPSKEYLTLRGDGEYILQIQLAGRNEEEVTGKFSWKDKAKTLWIYRNGERQEAEITGNKLHLDTKVYKKTGCGHI